MGIVLERTISIHSLYPGTVVAMRRRGDRLQKHQQAEKK